jgi:hypothetical protein
MTGVCFFCGERMVLRPSRLMPNPDAAKHLRECWIYRMLKREEADRG